MNLYQELAEYTRRPLELVTQRCQTAPVELAWQWAKYKDDPLKFYRETDLYIFDLTMYQSHLHKRGFYSWYVEMIRTYGWQTMLDFGGGIGEYTIVAKDEGVKPTFLEVADSHTLDYALWRFAKHGIDAEIWNENTGINRHFDFIMIMDVLEHLPSSQPLIAKLARRTEYIFANPEEVHYNWVYPQHISRYDLRSHFKHIDRNLWKSI